MGVCVTKKRVVMGSGMSAREAAVLQVGAGPSMGDAFVPGISFIFLFPARRGQGRALQWPNLTCRDAVQDRALGEAFLQRVPGGSPAPRDRSR